MKYILFFICALFLNTLIFSQENYKVGDTVPKFKLWLTNGDRLTENDIKNKVVVFKFWFTSCLPCRIDIPELNKLVKEYKDNKNVLFIAPALDRKGAIDRFLHYTPFKFKIAYSAMDVSQSFNKRQAYPFYYITDKNGKFLYVDKPDEKSQIMSIKKVIKEALKE